MPPAARTTDLHTCPMVNPGPVPHVGGPIIPPCSPTVLINNLPAATVTSMLTCVGPPDVIVKGSSGVFINFLPAARLGDTTAHGGVIVAGSPNVIIGEVGQGAPGTAGFSQVVTGTAVAKPPTVLPIVIKIDAHQSGTSGKRIPSNKRAVNHLKSSTARVESLAANPPVVLVRGGHSVSLTATTQPADQPVTWQVAPNENTHEAPSITPTHGGKRALLGSTRTGSFAVIASSGPSKVVWNVIFVSVEVQPETTKVTKRNNYVNGPAPGLVFFKSGEFAPNQYAWEATVEVKLVGGGTNNKMGIDKIELKVLQNGVADTLTAHYAGPPAGTAREKPKGGLPVLDANDVSSPTLLESIPAVTVTPHTGPKRKVWTGDSPTGAFPATHIPTGKPATSISGINGFSTAIVSTSKDAPTEYVLHAYTGWQAHFDGTADATGQYTPHGAHTSADTRYQLDCPDIGGRDACNAGFETFPPLFNTGTDTEWKP